MQIIADLHLHSRFSRAVSQEMTIPNLALWAAKKGIGLIATSDWTHPMWMREIKANLEEQGNGLLSLRAEIANKNLDPSSVAGSNKLISSQNKASEAGQNFIRSPHGKLPLFLLSTEISCIYSQAGKTRRIHILVMLPSLASADKICQELTKRGCNLLSDGRPIIGLSSIELADLIFTIEPKALVIPAHAWTPWFSVYGSMSGFDSISEAFGKFAKDIYAVETGLSSSPDMNWRIAELKSRAIISNSDAHSGPKLGREATVFEMPELSYENLRLALIGNKKNCRIAYTIEFYPEEGKYHYTGHRTCNIRLTPLEAKEKGSICPVCGKPLTQGVMQRVEQLAGISEKNLRLTKIQYPIAKNVSVQMLSSKSYPERPPFVSLVPLAEIIAEATKHPVASIKTKILYEEMIDKIGPDFQILLESTLPEIEKVAGSRVAEGIDKVRRGDIVIDPGYDGVFGIVKIWHNGESLVDKSKEQLSIF